MPFRQHLTRGMAVFLMAAGLVAPLAAQQGSWEELNAKVVSLYRQGKYAEALSFAQEALQVAETRFGPEHPNLAMSLNNLAGLYSAQGRYSEAEPLYKRSLTIVERALGPDHLNVATSLTTWRRCTARRASMPKHSRSTFEPSPSGRKFWDQTIPMWPRA